MIIGFKPKINVSIIYTFDGKPQEMVDFDFQIGNINGDESELVRHLIGQPYPLDYHLLNDLCKVSMAFSCEVDDFVKLPIIKKIFDRGGKYYFQPNQRDEVESAVIEDTEIAKFTANFEG